MAMEKQWVLQETVDMVSRLRTCPTLPGWMRMPDEQGQVTDHWCVGPKVKVETLLKNASELIMHDSSTMRVLNERIIYVKDADDLFVGWIQLLHLQDEQTGFREAWGRMRELGRLSGSYQPRRPRDV